jgi:hypothetical protein
MRQIPVRRGKSEAAEVVALPDLPGFFPVTSALGAIDRAIGLLAKPGTPRFERLSEGARCPLPPLGLADTLLRDAWDVLAGNPYAVRSFVETIEQLNAGHQDMPDVPKDWTEGRDGKVHAHRQWTPEDRPSVAAESAIPLLAAAAAIADACHGLPWRCHPHRRPRLRHGGQCGLPAASAQGRGRAVECRRRRRCTPH